MAGQFATSNGHGTRTLETTGTTWISPTCCGKARPPFAQGFFDAVISVDAYQYFGTDALYLDYLSRFVRPSGLLGVVIRGLMQAHRQRATRAPGTAAGQRQGILGERLPVLQDRRVLARSVARLSEGDASGRRGAAGRMASLARLRTRSRGKREEPVSIRCGGAGRRPREIHWISASLGQAHRSDRGEPLRPRTRCLCWSRQR